MIQEDARQNFEQLLAVERQNLNERVGQEIDAATMELSRRGVLRSGAGMKMVTRPALDAVPIFAQACLNVFGRVSGAHGIAIADDNQAEVNALLDKCIRDEVEQLKSLVRSAPSMKQRGMEGTAHTVLQGIDKVAEREIARLGAEISLIAAGQAVRGQTQGASNAFTFNAPVGVVQTGPGSHAVAHQTMDASAREALEKALQQVITQLQATTDIGDTSVDLAEIRELASEADAELKKDIPNQTRIRSIIRGVGEAIAYVPKLREAYDTLKWAGALIGINLQ